MLAPAILAAVPFLSGAAAAISFVDWLGARFAFLAAVAGLLALVAATALILQDDEHIAACVVVVGCGLAGLALGATAAHEAYRAPLLTWFETAAPTDPVPIDGLLCEDAAPTGNGISLTLRVVAVDGYRSTGASLGGVRLTVTGAIAPRLVDEWRAGRLIRIRAFLRRPFIYVNPGASDDRRALARRGIVLVGSVKSGALVEVLRRGGAISEAAATIRGWTRSRIVRHIAPLDAKSAGVTTAVLIGDRSGLAAEDEQRLQEAGTYHVIAISGGNVAILAIFAMLVCRTLLIPPRITAVLAALGLLFYGAIAGGAASVARAVTVAVLMFAAHALDHRSVTLNALAIAAVVGVAASPVVVLDAGFILSFGATVGIVLGAPLLVGRNPRRRTALARLAGQALLPLAVLGAATICAEIVVLPVSATFFSRVTFAGLILNFAAIPLMTAVQVAGLIVVASSSILPAVADVAALGAHVAASALLRSAHLVQVAPSLAVDVRPPVWWLVAGYYAGALGLLAPRPRRYAALLLATASIAILAGADVTTREAVPQATMPLRIVILDVGQGDATVLQLPGGRAILVDSGGLPSFSLPDAHEPGPSFDIGERVVSPALRALGVSRLDAIVITHGDPDHLSGARGVLRHRRVESVWQGIPVPPHPGLRGLATLVRARGMVERTVQAGDVERFGDVDIRVLHPPLPDWERQRVRNEDSVVLEVRLGRVSVILPGDIGREAEATIRPRLEPGRLVVLKAPHHGSATSSTKPFLDALRPSVVVFSCGRDNRFGHPHPAVVERYRTMGTTMFSTAEDGAVFVETDGTTVEVRGWRGRRQRFDVVRR